MAFYYTLSFFFPLRFCFYLRNVIFEGRLSLTFFSRKGNKYKSRRVHVCRWSVEKLTCIPSIGPKAFGEDIGRFYLDVSLRMKLGTPRNGVRTTVGKQTTVVWQDRD